MSKSSGGGGTIKVTDDYLNDFVTKNIIPFQQAMLQDPPIVQLAVWANQGGETPGATNSNLAYHYGKVMGGITNGTFTSGTTLATNFATLAKNIGTQITTMYGDMDKLRKSLINAHATLNNGDDDTLTTAQMMDLLNPAFGSSTSPPA